MKSREVEAQAAPGAAFAKTTRPAVGATVARERLFAKLDGTPGRTVMWIAGQPGAGKTTLAAGYIESRALASLWYQVDADDDDPATLFHYLGHAARKLPGAGLADLPAFGDDDRADVGAFARRFFRRLLSGARPPFALVLDNLHALAAGSALAVALEAAAGQVPRGSCIIVTSRESPPAAFARLRVSGELVLIDAGQLRADPDELIEMAALRGYPLDEATALRLHERTGGWVAGLVLMLEHAKLGGTLADMPGEALPAVVFDYLAGEIFERFDARTRRFLLAVACLPRMSVEIARRLSGEEKAPRLLLNLALNNYFVAETRSAEARGYRFHPLLREFLKNRAAHEAPALLGFAHLKAAAGLLHEAGYGEDAVALCLENRDWDQLAEIAASLAPDLLAQGRHETLAFWLESLPGALLHARSDLLMAFATCRARTSPRAARRLYEEAFDALEPHGDKAAMVRCGSAIVETLVDEFDDLAPLDRWIAVLAGLRGAAGDTRADAALARAMLLRGATDPERMATLERCDAPFERAVARALGGDAAAADHVLLARPADGATADTREGLRARVTSAIVALLGGDPAAAAALAEECLAQAVAKPGHAAWLHAIAAAALLACGKHEAARAHLLRLEAGGETLRRGDRAILHYLRAWLADAEGDTPGALREARGAVALAAEAGLPWCECLARLGLARMLAVTGDPRGADLHLRVADGLAGGAANVVLGFALRLARAEIAAGGAGADAALAQAFGFGREHGLRDAPWWRPRALAELCVRAIAAGIEAEYARDLVKSRGLMPARPPLRLRNWPWAFRIETFGSFRLLRDERPIEFSGKGPGRPTELLKVLIALGGQNVRTDQLADALWPNAEADYAHKSFTAALHRLRRLFGDDAVILLRDSRLSLNPEMVWLDAWALEEIVGDIEQLARSATDKQVPAALGALLDEALATYRGPFLADESEQPAYIACREQTRARLLRCVSRLMRIWEEAGMPAQAVDGIQRLIDADPLFEAPYRHLMLLCKRRGDLIEARATYERLRNILSMRLKVLPSADTQAVYAEMIEPGRG